MNFNFSPSTQCLLHFQDERSYVRWIGFDKYRKFLFGFRNSVMLNEKELVKRSVFSGKTRFIKILPWPRVTSHHFLNIHAAISSCGEYIIFIRHPNVLRSQSDKWQGVVELFLVETGESHFYRFSQSLSDRYISRLELVHTSNFGWVCNMKWDSLCESLTLYRIAFNESRKFCTFQCMHNWKSADVDALSVVTKRSAMLFSRKSNSIIAYDFGMQQAITSNILNKFPNNANFSCDFIMSSEDGHILIAITSHQLSKIFNFYTLADTGWKKLNISFNPAAPLENAEGFSYEVESAFCTNNLLFCKIKANDGFLANLNIMSLQDIAFKKLLDCFNHVGEKEFMEIMHLPVLMKRKYFGPMWAYENYDDFCTETNLF